MATYKKSDASIEWIFLRRLLAGGNEVYERQPYNLVDYKDGNGQFLEPVEALGYGNNALTWEDQRDAGEAVVLRILDSHPWFEATQIR